MAFIGDYIKQLEVNKLICVKLRKGYLPNEEYILLSERPLTDDEIEEYDINILPDSGIITKTFHNSLSYKLKFRNRFICKTRIGFYAEGTGAYSFDSIDINIKKKNINGVITLLKTINHSMAFTTSGTTEIIKQIYCIIDDLQDIILNDNDILIYEIKYNITYISGTGDFILRQYFRSNYEDSYVIVVGDV